MLRIQIGKQFLDLLPSAAIEMQLNSPLFLTEAIYGDYSVPVNLPYTENNVRLLGNVFDEDAKLAQYYDAQVFDDTNFLFGCKLILDKPSPNIKHAGKGTVEGYLLGGNSLFFYEIKYQRVGQLQLGGTRTFANTGYNPWDGSSGIWQHLHATWDGTYDYVCLPYINESASVHDPTNEYKDYFDTLFSGWANQLDWGHLYDGLLFHEPGYDITIGPSNYGTTYNDVRMRHNDIVPAPILSIKVKFIMECICAENGWTLDSSLIDAENFDKLLMVGNVPINIIPDRIPGSAGEFKSTISFNLGALISPEITCTDFIMQRCKRYGWWPKIDADNKTVQLVPLKNINIHSKIKDWTKYADPQQFFDATGGIRTFAFKNNFPNGDNFPSQPKFSDYIIEPPVASAENLPAATAYFDNSLCLCEKENAFYHVVYDEDLPLATDPTHQTYSRKWQWFCDNIYDVAPDNTSDINETNVTTMPLHYTLYRVDNSGNKYYGGFLRCDMNQQHNWGMRDVFYWGLVTEKKLGLTVTGFTYAAQYNDYLNTYGSINKSLTNGTLSYPFASPIPLLPDGTVTGNWANVFKTASTLFKGIIDYWWKQWLSINSNAIANTVNLNLPLFELVNLQYDSIINIKNIPFLLKQLVLPVPYRGTAQATLQPVILDKTVLQQSNIPYSGPIYLKVQWDITTITSDPLYGDYGEVKSGIAKIYAYQDADGTVPVSPNNLGVFVYRKIIATPNTANLIYTEKALLININAPVTAITKDGQEYYNWTDAFGTNNLVQYIIQADDNAAYQVID